MLVEINPSVGGVSTDTKTKFFNFLCSLHAVSTASAGSSPVVNPVNTSGVKDTNYNCITVLANSEAGGWFTGASNNITESTVFSSSAAAYFVDLYNSTGKTSAPYYRMVFCNVTYPFSNASFATYPQLEYITGHTLVNPASDVFTNDSNRFTVSTSQTSGPGTTSTGRLGGGTNWTGNPSATPLNILSPDEKVYVSCTSKYMIIAGAFGMMYFGERTVAPWELTRTDNPPWVGFAYHIRNMLGSGSTSSWAIRQGWSSTLLFDKTSQTTPVKHGISEFAIREGVSGLRWDNNNSLLIPSGIRSVGTFGSVLNGLAPLTHPLASSLNYPNSTTTSLALILDEGIVDPVTGFVSPPSFPLIARFWGGDTNTGSAMGVLLGILRGPTSTDYSLSTMLTQSEYTIGSSVYIPVIVNSVTATTFKDTFFIRKA